MVCPMAHKALARPVCARACSHTSPESRAQVSACACATCPCTASARTADLVRAVAMASELTTWMQMLACTGQHAPGRRPAAQNSRSRSRLGSRLRRGAAAGGGHCGPADCAGRERVYRPGGHLHCLDRGLDRGLSRLRAIKPRHGGRRSAGHQPSDTEGKAGWKFLPRLSDQNAESRLRIDFGRSLLSAARPRHSTPGRRTH